MVVCLICGLPLPLEELNLNRSWHSACQICHFCGGETTREIVLKCLETGAQIYHTPCKTQAALQELRNSVLPAGLDQIKALNEKILVKEWNQARPDEGDFSLLSNLLKELKEITKNVAFMLDHTKSKGLLKATEEYRETLGKEKKARAAQQASETEQENAKQATRQQREAEKADPQLRQRRKLIENYMNLMKLSEGEATAFLDAEIAKQQSKQAAKGLN